MSDETQVTRIYRVDEKDGEGRVVASFLVRTTSPARAVRHTARRFAAEVASQDDIATLIIDGVKVENA